MYCSFEEAEQTDMLIYVPANGLSLGAGPTNHQSNIYHKPQCFDSLRLQESQLVNGLPKDKVNKETYGGEGGSKISQICWIFLFIFAIEMNG